MKKIEKTIFVYICEYCGKEFPENEKACLQHELHMHKCPNCKHHFYLFGSEEMCDVSNNCQFEQKTE